ncbi:MAG: S8 family serine peptidase [Robinsoniella sp.]|nr:S8 family serine peptidase [Robinsoniella sp.]
MTDQKIENLLNLALNATEDERARSVELNVGYDEEDQMWDLIVRYHGDLMRLETDEIQIAQLYAGYAIVTIPERLIPYLAGQLEVEYIEKPKRLFFSVNQGRTASCMNALQYGENALSGRGILVAVIDSGVDYFHPDFRNTDGTTRILNIWDQTVAGNPPQGYRIGTEYSREQINEALNAPNEMEARKVVQTRDLSGHGTEVLGIAAGNGRASGGVYRGVAWESDILVVKLGQPKPNSFPRTTELMQALAYVAQKAQEYEMPFVVNLSFGNVYGSHDGLSILETYLDNIAQIGKSVIVTGTGNEGETGGHTSGILQTGRNEKVEFGVSEYELSLNLQIWKEYEDDFDIILVHPSGRRTGPFQNRLGTQRYVLGDTEILVYYGEPSPYSPTQEIYLSFLPIETYVDSGMWSIELVPRNVVTGRYDMWLPEQGVLNEQTRFYQPVPETTLTIPSTARNTIAVGAYDSRLLSYAPFSGRGYTRDSNQVKPDLVAPGVEIMTTAVNGGYTRVTGTSFAAPFVTGAAALMMQWGIVKGHDPYLYGQKVKAYLRKGAVHLPGFHEWPNPTLGYGEDVIIRLQEQEDYRSKQTEKKVP